MTRALQTVNTYLFLRWVTVSNLATLVKWCGRKIKRGSQQKLGVLGPLLPWDYGVVRPSPRGSACWVWSLLVKRYEHGAEILQKDWESRVPPFKVTHGHRKWHRSMAYLWFRPILLVINRNNWMHSRTDSKIISYIENATFSYFTIRMSLSHAPSQAGEGLQGHQRFWENTYIRYTVWSKATKFGTVA